MAESHPFCFLDGRIVRREKAALPADDPAIAWGIGLFETLRAYRGKPFRLTEHLRRMKRSARHFGIPATLPDLRTAVPDVLRRNRCPDAAVRITLTGAGRCLVQSRPLPPIDSSWKKKGIKLLTAPWRRDPDSPTAGHKTLNYLSLLKTREAVRRKGAFDALLLSPDGKILEGAASNFFLVKRGRLLTPPDDGGILPGVGRETAIRIARKRDIPLQEHAIVPGDIRKADEAFVTNSVVEVLPVSHVDGKPVSPPGPVTEAIADGYRRWVERACGTKGS